jgi:hypothetical protein
VALPDRPGFTFGNAHRALALAGQEDTDGLVTYEDLLEELAASGHPTAGDCAQFTRALRYLIGGDPGQAADRLMELLPRFRNFGGSHAQTEVFEDTTIAALEMCGRHEQAAELLTARLDRRRSGRDKRWLARLAGGSKD